MFGGDKPTKAHRGDGTGFRASVIKLSLAMHPFSISINEHASLKFLMIKRLRKITRK